MELDLRGQAGAVALVGQGRLLLQGLWLRNLAVRTPSSMDRHRRQRQRSLQQQPGSAPGQALALPLWFFDTQLSSIAQASSSSGGGAAVVCDGVTLDLPVQEYGILYAAALRGAAWKTTASANAAAAALLSRVVRLELAAAPTASQVSLATYEGWGVNATRLVLRPAGLFNPASLAAGLLQQPNPPPVAPRPVPSPGQPSGQQAGSSKREEPGKGLVAAIAVLAVLLGLVLLLGAVAFVWICVRCVGCIKVPCHMPALTALLMQQLQAVKPDLLLWPTLCHQSSPHAVPTQGTSCWPGRQGAFQAAGGRPAAGACQPAGAHATKPAPAGPRRRCQQHRFSCSTPLRHSHLPRWHVHPGGQRGCASQFWGSRGRWQRLCAVCALLCNCSCSGQPRGGRQAAPPRLLQGHGEATGAPHQHHGMLGLG